MTTGEPNTFAALQRTLLILTTGMLGAVIVIAVIAAFTIAEPFGDPDPMWMLFLPLAAGAVTVPLGLTISGQQLRAAEASGGGPAQINTAHIIRIAMFELPAMLGFVATFVADSAIPVFLGAGISAIALSALGMPIGALGQRYQRIVEGDDRY